jgi:hypothetical protein
MKSQKFSVNERTGVEKTALTADMQWSDVAHTESLYFCGMSLLVRKHILDVGSE